MLHGLHQVASIYNAHISTCSLFVITLQPATGAKMCWKCMHIARLFEARFLTEELQIIKDFAHSLVLEYPAHQSQGKLFNPMTCRPWGYYDHLEGWGMLNCWYEHWYLAGNRQWLCPCARNCMPTCRSSFGTYLLETHKHTQTHTNTHTHTYTYIWSHVLTLTHTYIMCRYGEDLPEELRDFPTTVLLASFTGFLFGGMIGARHAGDKFIALNHSSKFTSVMQAQVSTCWQHEMSCTYHSTCNWNNIPGQCILYHGAKWSLNYMAKSETPYSSTPHTSVSCYITHSTTLLPPQRELHGAAMLGFVSKGARWGWRMGVFAGIFRSELLRACLIIIVMS